jgi:hypothetical protein
MDDEAVERLINVLGAIADYMIFQMAFQYQLRNPELPFNDALQYSFDRLGELQQFIPQWVQARDAQEETPSE